MILLSHVRDNFAEAFYPRLSEWWAAGLLLAMGWVLSANPDLMFGAKTQVYETMLMIAPQEGWAAIMKVFAAGRLITLLINGAWRRSPHLRALGAFLSSFFWMQITLSSASTFGLVFVFAAGVLTLDFLNMIRATRDARTVDYARAKGGPKGDSH